MKIALRWLAVLPASLCAVGIVITVNYLCTGTDIMSQFLSRYWLCVLKGLAFVGGGTYVAPAFRKETAVVLTVIGCAAIMAFWGYVLAVDRATALATDSIVRCGITIFVMVATSLSVPADQVANERREMSPLL